MTSSIRDPHEDDQLLTMEEVSDVVRVPIATLRYWRHLGMGPHGFRVGRNVRYWRLDVLEWLRQQANEDAADIHSRPRLA